MSARDMEVPMTEGHDAAEAQSGNAMKDILDVPYITRQTGVDFLAMCFLGVVLGLLSIPYCAGVSSVPFAWLEYFGPAGLIEESENLHFLAGSRTWILLCWGFCTVAGILKALLKLDTYPSFIEELKHQHVDPWVSFKVVACCIVSLSAGAVMGLEAGLGSLGGVLGMWLGKAMERLSPSPNELEADTRRRAYILCGLAAAFGTILPAPFVSVILVAEIASAGTERHAQEDEFMQGRRLPKKVLFYLVPAATAAFVMRWAIVSTPMTSHPYYVKGYDNLSVFTGVGLGCLAAVCALIFILVGAIMKGLFTVVARPLERRLGLPTRQVVCASLAGVITGVAIYFFPLTISSGKEAMGPCMKFAPDLTAGELLGIAMTKCVAYWACASGGLVGGIFFPLLFYGLAIGEACAKIFSISPAIAVPVMLGAVPGALLPAPITALSFPVGLFVTGPIQTVPILTAIVVGNALLAPAPGPSCWEALSQHAEEARKLRCQDPIEEYLIGKHVETLTLRGKPKATFQDGLDGLLKLTWFTEPEVAEFLEFVFSEFRSTSMVWCFLDSKQDGIVTLEDFCREMRCLRSRNHRQPVEAHMLGLFDQLDTNKQNRVRLADVLAQGLDAGKGRQALLARFRGFLEELTSSEDPKMKELRETYTSPSKAFKTSAAGKVTRANFIEGLYRLQYDEWHLSSLFARIDRDGSGDITMEDLLNFLREAGPGGRYRMPVATRAMPEVRERGTNKLVQLNHSSIDASAKLSQLNDWFSDERPLHDLGVARASSSGRSRTIDELAGNVATKNDRISIALVKITEPTSEPWLTLHYDEWMCVLKGRLVLLHGSGSLEVPAGQTVYIPRGERFRPTFPDGNTEYIPVCLPAFRPDRCLREEGNGSDVSAKLQELHGGKAGYPRPALSPAEDPAPEVMYHMCQKSLLEEAQKSDEAYFPPTFEKDGFTHATAVPSRLLDTANHFYQDVPGDWVCIRFRRSALRRLGIITRDEQAKPVGKKEISSAAATFVWPHVFGGIPPQVVDAEFPMLREGRAFVSISGLTRVFKLATASEELKFREQGHICSALDEKDGFVHLSDSSAAPVVARSFFSGVQDLMLLEIDPDGLPAPITWVLGSMSDPAPDAAKQKATSVIHYLKPEGCVHVYGKVPMDAVLRAEAVPLQDGAHVFPSWLS
ncbi:unnamed protein product [Effrenium voratum]|nr:unnamed protein product [Effrenium voratum]